VREGLAGALGGLAAGLLVTGAMAFGRRAGLLHRTLAEHAEDWLDNAFALRCHIGSGGVTIAEQTNHLLASAAFGAAYGLLRGHFEMPPLIAGALYGAGLYAVNIVGLAPLIGLTRGETLEPPGVVLQRLAMHLAFGVATAAATELMIDDRPRPAKSKITR
jgi:hypothetical protein